MTTHSHTNQFISISASLTGILFPFLKATTKASLKPFLRNSDFNTDADRMSLWFPIVYLYRPPSLYSQTFFSPLNLGEFDPRGFFEESAWTLKMMSLFMLSGSLTTFSCFSFFASKSTFFIYASTIGCSSFLSSVICLSTGAIASSLTALSSIISGVLVKPAIAPIIAPKSNIKRIVGIKNNTGKDSFLEIGFSSVFLCRDFSSTV
jgi:hypothetical protein